MPKLDSESTIKRCHVELANYFAAAVLMPYDAVHAMAEQSGYDIDRMASAFAVSFEQSLSTPNHFATGDETWCAIFLFKGRQGW